MLAVQILFDKKRVHLGSFFPKRKIIYYILKMIFDGSLKENESIILFVTTSWCTEIIPFNCVIVIVYSSSSKVESMYCWSQINFGLDKNNLCQQLSVIITILCNVQCLEGPLLFRQKKIFRRNLQHSIFNGILRNFTKFLNSFPAESWNSVKFRRNSGVWNPAGHCSIAPELSGLGPKTGGGSRPS